MQIRTRLTLLFVVIAAGILLGVLAGVYWLFKKNTEENFYQGLASKLSMTEQTALRDPATLRVLPNDWVAPDGDSLPYSDNISIYNDAYERVFTLRTDAPPVSVKDLQDIYQNGESHFNHFNLLALGKMTDNSFAVVVEGYCDPSMLANLRINLIIGFFAGLMLVAFFGWYYAGKALEPMSGIVNEVHKIQPSDLSKRVGTGNNKDELARLADTFNQLLDRVQQAFVMQRMFLSNVSHELRNPLAAMRSQLEVSLQRSRDADMYRKTIESVLEDVRGMGELEEKLHQLARIYNDPKAIPFSRVRIDELLWQARQQLRKRHEEFRATVEIDAMPEDDSALLIHANEALLLTAILNLMHNACKYSPDHSVVVKAHFDPLGAHHINVCDKGPGIPDAEKQLIFEPFFRRAQHIGVKGTGIGLSLVQSILSLHQIHLSVESPAEGGAVFSMEFPQTIYLSQDD